MIPNDISNTTTGALVSPVTPAQFADFMSLPYVASDDELLNSFLLAACEMCISHTSNELLERTWIYRADRNPEISKGYGGLGPISATLAPWIELPLTPVQSITGITLDGDAYTDFTSDLNSTPARIELQDNGVIEITYLAGHPTATTIDSRLLLGIKMLAQYLFDNRGCDVTMAIEMSGAAAIWYTIRMLIGGL